MPENTLKITQKLNNPFKISVMRNAYQALKIERKNNDDRITVMNDDVLEYPVPNYLYLKFKPQNQHQVRALYNWDTSANFSTIPADIQFQGISMAYREAGLADSIPTPVYANIPINQILLDTIAYEILDSLYLPDLSEAEPEGNSTNNAQTNFKTNVNLALLTKAFEITGNSKINTSETDRQHKEQAVSNATNIVFNGKIGYYDDGTSIFSSLSPLENLPINLSIYGFNLYRVISGPETRIGGDRYRKPTEKIGSYVYDNKTRSGGNFTIQIWNKINQIINTDNILITHRLDDANDGMWFALTNVNNDYLSISYYLSSYSPGSSFGLGVNNINLGGTYSFYTAVWRAAKHYWHGNIHGLTRPPSRGFWGDLARVNDRILIRCFSISGTSSMDFTRQAPSFGGLYNANDAIIHMHPSPVKNNIKNFRTTIHEIGHLVHWKLGTVTFPFNNLRETFANGMEDAISEDFYPQYPKNVSNPDSFAGEYNRNGYTAIIRDLIDGRKVVKSFQYQKWTSITQIASLPNPQKEYLSDGITENYYSYNDNCDACFTIKEIEQVVGAYQPLRLEDFQARLVQRKPQYINEINAVFGYWLTQKKP